MSETKNTKNLIKWIVCFAIPIAIALIPTSEAFTPIIKSFFIITLFAIAIIATEVLPLFAVSLALPVTYIVVLKVESKIAFAAWSIDVPWLILGGFVLTIALQRTGLMKRVAYKLILLCGGSFKGIIFGMAILGMIVSLIIVDVAAKAIMFGALALGICQALNLKMGGKAASAMAASALVSALGPSLLYYTGSNANLVPFGLFASAGGVIPTWTEYLTHMFVPQFVNFFLAVLVIVIFFKPDEEIQSKEFFKNELKSYGKMSAGEIKITIIAIVLIGLVVTSSMHKIGIGWLFVYAAVLLMLPGIDLVKPADIKEVNFSFILFVVACLCIGIVSVNLGVGKFIADSLYPVISGGGTTQALAGVWGLGFIINFALTPLAAYSAFTVPIVDMATAMGINPVPVLYAFIQSLEQVVFPYEYAPVLIVFGMGMASGAQFIKYNVMRAIVAFACLFIVFMPWWNLMGLI